MELEVILVKEQNNTILNCIPQVDQLDVSDALKNEINHFVECCQTGKKGIAPVKDGVEVMKMIKATYESAETGKEIFYNNLTLL